MAHEGPARRKPLPREVVGDTETTGRSHKNGDRLVEIGLVELRDGVPTGNTYRQLINPERPIPEDASRVHNIYDQDVADMPVFADVVDEVLAFLGDDPFIAHNARFDVGFLNAELARLDRPPMQNEIVDTMTMYRKINPNAVATLDAICSHYKIDLSARSFHGALLDANLLAAAYLEMCGGRERLLDLSGPGNAKNLVSRITMRMNPDRSPFVLTLSAEEEQAHATFLSKLVKDRKPLWSVELEAAPQMRM